MRRARGHWHLDKALTPPPQARMVGINLRAVPTAGVNSILALDL